MPSDDQTTREAIGGLIAAVQPDAQVYPWNVLCHDLNDWPGLFGPGRIGYVIKRAAQSAERKNATRDRRHADYSVLCFLKFTPGKLGVNSDENFAERLSRVYDAIKAQPKLGLGIVEYHELLQYKMITTIKCGEETLHFADGSLRVTYCC